MQEIEGVTSSFSEHQRKMPLATASLILGFLGCVMFGILAGIPAVICGHISLNKLKQEHQNNKNRRIAFAGLILGYIGIIMTIILAIGLLMIYYDWGPFNI